MLLLNSQAPEPLITTEDVKNIFFGIEKVLETNRKFLKDLELVVYPPKNRVVEYGEEVLTKVDQVILKHVKFKLNFN